jgi:hypothetical protein
MTKPDMAALQGLWEKATKGEWKNTLHHDCVLIGDCFSMTGIDNAALIVALHNAFPAIKARMEELERKLAEAEPVVLAACRLVAADIYVHPTLSRQQAVEQGNAELYDAVGKWNSAQPACAGESAPPAKP